MSGTALRSLVAFVAVLPPVVWSAVRALRVPTTAAAIQVLGAAGLLAVVAAHICEGFRLLPGMGWGEPRSPGHFVDLVGALVGLTLLPGGYLLSRRDR